MAILRVPTNNPLAYHRTLSVPQINPAFKFYFNNISLPYCRLFFADLTSRKPCFSARIVHAEFVEYKVDVGADLCPRT